MAIKSILKGAPFLIIIIPLIISIWMYDYWKPSFALYQLIGIISILLMVNLVLLFLRKILPKIINIFSTISIFFLLLFIGLLVSWNYDIKNDRYWIGKTDSDSINIWRGKIIEKPVEKANTFLAVVQIEEIQSNGKIEKANGKILAYFKKENWDTTLQPGQYVYSNSSLKLIKNFGDSSNFNYRQFINRQNIYHQTYIKNNYQKGEYIKPIFIVGYLDKVQQYVLKTINAYIPFQKIAGIAKALIVGYKQDLDKDLYQQYINIGVVHVIAISGLHVGIISYIIGLLFFPMHRHKKTKRISIIIHLTLLWGFCFLAGGTPSILRACLCFSILEIGKNYMRPIINHLQSLALSAFIILLLSPFSLFQLGFILSYAALIGLFLVAPYLQSRINTKNCLVFEIWKIISTTLSAQIFVIPITLFLFHQFSIYFIVSNLFIVPLSIVALISIIVLLAVGWLPLIAYIVGYLTAGIIALMNLIVVGTSSLPYALFTNIAMSFWEMILLYVLAILLVFWIRTRKNNVIK